MSHILALIIKSKILSDSYLMEVHPMNFTFSRHVKDNKLLTRCSPRNNISLRI